MGIFLAFLAELANCYLQMKLGRGMVGYLRTNTAIVSGHGGEPSINEPGEYDD